MHWTTRRDTSRRAGALGGSPAPSGELRCLWRLSQSPLRPRPTVLRYAWRSQRPVATMAASAAADPVRCSRSDALAWPSIKTLAIQSGLRPTRDGRNSAVSAALARLEDSVSSGPCKPAQATRGRASSSATRPPERHSFASLVLAEGRSVRYVARQLGHAPSMTLDVYGHVSTSTSTRPVDAGAEIRAARSGANPAAADAGQGRLSREQEAAGRGWLDPGYPSATRRGPKRQLAARTRQPKGLRLRAFRLSARDRIRTCDLLLRRHSESRALRRTDLPIDSGDPCPAGRADSGVDAVRSGGIGGDPGTGAHGSVPAPCLGSR